MKLAGETEEEAANAETLAAPNRLNGEGFQERDSDMQIAEIMELHVERTKFHL